MSVTVLVLGDVGRSPRMQCHALSFAAANVQTTLLGFGGSSLPTVLRENSRIQVANVREVPRIAGPRIFAHIVKAIAQTLFLLYALFHHSLKSDAVLVQNPPTIPTLAVTWLFCRLTGAKFLIDWHNYGYTLLQLQYSKKHPLVTLALWCERFFGRRADLGFCVTAAMRDDLRTRWGITAVTFHDRPRDCFKKCSQEEGRALLSRLSEEYPVAEAALQDDCFFVVSSTSWTADEDFGHLLSALDVYAGDSTAPPLLLAITGKGPLKQYYTEELGRRKWGNVQVMLPWLAAEDYPLLLGSAHLGVSLHDSTSGLDLPMKIVDMFGCQLPVLALQYHTLSELVIAGHNGECFSDSRELAEYLTLFSRDRRPLQTMSDNLAHFPRWEEHWQSVVAPALRDLVPAFSL